MVCEAANIRAADGKETFYVAPAGG